MSLLVEYEALTGIEELLEAFPGATRQAARIALNDVSQNEGLAIYKKAVESQVDFGDGYLTPDRLGVTSKARDDALAVTITGRQRATSLARFARGQSVGGGKGRKGVRVRVKKGGPGETIENAWLVRLKRGSSQDRDNFNLGLAIRLQPGERLRGKREVRSVQLDQNVFLLYGPSVDQVFRDVAVTDTQPVLGKVGDEFFRQFFRLVKTTGGRRAR